MSKSNDGEARRRHSALQVTRQDVQSISKWESSEGGVREIAQQQEISEIEKADLGALATEPKGREKSPDERKRGLETREQEELAPENTYKTSVVFEAGASTDLAPKQAKLMALPSEA